MNELTTHCSPTGIDIRSHWSRSGLAQARSRNHHFPLTTFDVFDMTLSPAFGVDLGLDATLHVVAETEVCDVM